MSARGPAQAASQLPPPDLGDHSGEAGLLVEDGLVEVRFGKRPALVLVAGLNEGRKLGENARVQCNDRFKVCAQFRSMLEILGQAANTLY